MTDIHHPIIIVHKVEEREQYIILPKNLDIMMQKPELFGVLLSDLLDHIADMYNQTTGQDVRAQIFKVMCAEDELKQKDPKRGNRQGKILWPGKHS
jgi:hypothetical protein